MVIAAFDLSTTCSGVAIAEVVNGEIKSLRTLAIAPENVNPEILGFLRTKRTVLTPSKASVFSYVRTKGEIVTKQTKKARDLLYKQVNEDNRVSVMALGINSVMLQEKPDLVLMEANMSFRSMDVTRKLAEIAGVLMSLTITNGIPLIKINVNHARQFYDPTKLLGKFCLARTPQELKAMKDVTKEAFKDMLLTKYQGYDLDCTMTTDESDALVILDFHLMTKKS